MAKVVIEVNNLGKQYRLGMVGTSTMSDDLKRFLYKIRGKEDPFLKVGETNDRSKKGNSDYVWALKDINFKVKQGEVLGIIGKNGAGKSTLLKILSRTTLPTTGEYKIKGRIASLLEVGTGFHPDLSGRENIFLNGAILGMTKAEIKKQFDAIVDFSGVERYIDTPVKRYSSGMYVRLAFAVAAHLEPEILIIDEVLAVGDAEFQKKCLGKMKDVSEQGRTVLFVSHNTEAVASLCNKTLWLDKGSVSFNGDTVEGLKKYLANEKENLNRVVFSNYKTLERSGAKSQATLLSISLLKNKVPNIDFYLGDKIEINLEVKIHQKMATPEFGVVISNFKGQRFHHFVSSWDQALQEYLPGTYIIKIITNNINLYPSEYTMSCWIREHSSPSSDDFIEDAIRFNVIKNERQLLKQVNAFANNGGVYLGCEWNIELVQ